MILADLNESSKKGSKDDKGNDVSVKTIVNKFTSKSGIQITPKRLSGLEGIKKYKIIKDGINKTLFIGDDNEEYPMAVFMYFEKAEKKLSLTLPTGLNVRALKKLEAMIDGIVNKLDREDVGEFKDIKIKVTSAGLKIGRAETEDGAEPYSEKSPENNDKGANRNLKPGQTMVILVGKKSNKIPTILKDKK